MAIFAAEHRHKTASEDQLTSRVFGALAIMVKRNVLFEFLLKLTEGQNDRLTALRNSLAGLTDRCRDKLEVGLWEHFGVRHYQEGYPDVYIEGIPNHLIVVEVKENSKSTSEQIIAQYRSVARECRKNQNVVTYFLLTKDEAEPQAVDEARKRLRHHDVEICWVQWKQIWRWLTEMAGNPTLAETDRLLIDDLIQYLEDKRMKDTKEIKAEWFTEEVARSARKLNELYREICLMVLKLRDELDSLELKEVRENNKEASFWYNPEGDTYTDRKPLHDKDRQLIPSSIDMLYRDRRWRTSSLVEANIFIEAEISEPGFSVGFWNEGISQEDCGRLEEAATKAGFSAERGTLGKGRLYIDIRHYLIADSPTNAKSKDVTLAALKGSLARIRDFVRGSYGIEQTVRAGNKPNKKR